MDLDTSFQLFSFQKKEIKPSRSEKIVPTNGSWGRQPSIIRTSASLRRAPNLSASLCTGARGSAAHRDGLLQDSHRSSCQRHERADLFPSHHFLPDIIVAFHYIRWNKQESKACQAHLLEWAAVHIAWSEMAAKGMKNPSAFSPDTKGNIYVMTDGIWDLFLHEHSNLEFTYIISEHQSLGTVGNSQGKSQDYKK